MECHVDLADIAPDQSIRFRLGRDEYGLVPAEDGGWWLAHIPGEGKKGNRQYRVRNDAGRWTASPVGRYRPKASAESLHALIHAALD